MTLYVFYYDDYMNKSWIFSSSYVAIFFLLLFLLLLVFDCSSLNIKDYWLRRWSLYLCYRIPYTGLHHFLLGTCNSLLRLLNFFFTDITTLVMAPQWCCQYTCSMNVPQTGNKWFRWWGSCQSDFTGEGKVKRSAKGKIYYCMKKRVYYN